MWSSVGYYNGDIGALEDMTVPMQDRALYFGDGIYEATCVRNGIPFALDEHLDRMYNSLRLMQIPFRMDRAAIKAELQKVIDAAEPAPLQFLYWQISRGVCPRKHVFPEADVSPALMIYVKPHTMKPMDKAYKLITMEDIRFRLCHIKTLNLIPAVLANQKAVEQGCNEVVLHRGSRVTEGAHSNLSILKDGVFRTAPTDELILPGITRKHMLELCGDLGIPTSETPFTVTELMNADEIIVSASSIQVTPVESVDGIPVGGRDPARLKALQDAYRAKFERETQPRA